MKDDCCGCGDCDDEVAEDDCEEDEAALAPDDDAASRLPTWGLRPMPLSAPPPAAEHVSGSGGKYTACLTARPPARALTETHACKVIARA